MDSTYLNSMDKILKFGLAGLGVIITVGTTADFNVGSLHNFANNGWSGGEMCVMCHVPDNAEIIHEDSQRNKVNAIARHTVYDSPEMQSDFNYIQPDGASMRCLSCHDGTIAADSYGAGLTHNTISDPGDDFGIDMGNEHPVSFIYDSAMAARDPSLFDPMTKQVTIIVAGKSKTGTINEVMLYNGQLQCPSCHDVHGSFAGGKNSQLKVNNKGSALCLVCHNM